MAGTDGGRPSIYPTLLYADAKAAIRQLTEAFGFSEASVYESEDGTVMHAELVQGNGAVMLGSKGRGGVFDGAMKDAGPGGGVRGRGRRRRTPPARRGPRRGDPHAPDRPGLRLTGLPGPGRRGQHLELRHVRPRDTGLTPGRGGEEMRG